jgi:N-acetyl sugar amidotransferase
MKILIVCSGNSFDKNNFDIRQHHPFIFEQVLMLQERGVEFEYFYIQGKGFAGYLKNWIRLWDHLRNNSYTIIHAHNGLSAFISVLQPFCKTIVTFHGSDINQRKTRALSNFASLMAYYRIFVTSELYDKLYIKPSGNYSIIPCGINLDTFFPIDKNEARRSLDLKENISYVLFSSHFLNSSKNYPLAKKAMSLVPDAQLLELKDRSRQEVNLLLNAVDVLLLTSPYEGSPQVIKEAMACNCPVVSTNAGEVKAIFNNTDNCYVCPSDPEELAEKIKLLLQNPVRTKGRHSVARFDNKIIIEKILNIYRRFGIKGSYQRCTRGLWDTTMPGIIFDENGVSNFCKMQESLMEQYPRGEEGLQEWKAIVDKMKKDGQNKKYDCIIGVSGGTDSCYLLHIAHEYGLRVLAVNLDNGWSSDIAVKNIKAVTSALNYDLETYVIDYEKVKVVLKSYIMARLAWVDAPTDDAIKSVLYKAASREGLKYALNGGDFRSEGKQPLAWTYSDSKQLKYIVRKIGKEKLSPFPTLTLINLLFFGFVKRIKAVRPLYFLPYEKKAAKKLLQEKYGWLDYAGHHQENIFTKFIISYWLPVKFGIDKRIISYSAQVLSGELSRDEALQLLSRPAYLTEIIGEDISYVLKKLNLSRSDFDSAFYGDNKYYYDYPSFFPLILKFAKFGKYLSKKIFGFKPGFFEAIDQQI